MQELVGDADLRRLEAWRRAVGPPVVVSATPPEAPPPSLQELVAVSWNVDLGTGRVHDLVSDLRAGRVAGLPAARHLVLILQEMHRRGPEVPEMTPDADAAAEIAIPPGAPDIRALAASLGLHTVYVPSMRNGAHRREDRGNAILSTEPLAAPCAVELPFERQRRVAVAASVRVMAGEQTEPLHLVNVHLDALSARSALWVFENPRRRQMAAVFELLEAPRFARGAGTILAGDFNTIRSGAREEIYRAARTWSRGLEREDPRSTHAMGRLDYVFARLARGWSAETIRLDDRYGSDHFPVAARFRRLDEAR